MAIGYRAIQNGFDTLCITAAKLIEDLSNASAKGLLHQSSSAYTGPHVLVIDEIGYLSYGPDAANVLFHVVNDRHLKKRPMIFTTNKPLSQWERRRTTRTGQPPSDRVWNVDASSILVDPPDGPVIKLEEMLRRPKPIGLKFPELTAQNFRNPHYGKVQPPLQSRHDRNQAFGGQAHSNGAKPRASQMGDRIHRALHGWNRDCPIYPTRLSMTPRIRSRRPLEWCRRQRIRSCRR